MTDKSWALQRKLLRAPSIGFNAEIYNWFKDVDSSDLPKRKTLRDSLLIQAKESRTSAMFKIQYFRESIQKVYQKQAIIGTFKDNFDADVTYKCRIELWFEESKASVSVGRNPLDAHIGWRLNETSHSITNAELKSIATKIKSAFGGHPTHSWNKGKILCLYKDKQHGYDFQIYALNTSVGENLIRKILEMNGHPYNEDLFRHSEPKRSNTVKPGSQTILGKAYQKNKWRPNGKVYFQHAQAIIHGIPEPLTLIDYSGERSNPLLKAY